MRTTVTALATTALVLLPTLPANATAPRASLVLTVSHPEDRGPGTRSVNLRCGPAGGSHPRAAAACADLERTGGSIERAPAPGTACTMIYAPVIAEATGRWHGRRIRFHRRYGNPCELAARTGSIFRF